MELKLYLPNGQVHLKFYLPQHKIYLPRTGGQCLMSSPDMQKSFSGLSITA